MQRLHLDIPQGLVIRIVGGTILKIRHFLHSAAVGFYLPVNTAFSKSWNLYTMSRHLNSLVHLLMRALTAL